MGSGPKTRLNSEEVSANVKLDGWKEIAAYLDRDPRTVQLWEKQEAFPVHRLAHTSRSTGADLGSQVGASYSVTLKVTGGISPYT